MAIHGMRSGNQGIADDIEEPGMYVPDVDDLEEDIDDSVN